jgi:hypothetical protein
MKTCNFEPFCYVIKSVLLRGEHKKKTILKFSMPSLLTVFLSLTLNYLPYPTPFAHYVIFVTEFVLLIKTPPFYEVNSFNKKWHAHGGISKIFFSRPLFTIIFSSEML